MSGTGVKDLDARLTGDVVAPDDDGWDAARQAWNLAINQEPAARAGGAPPPPRLGSFPSQSEPLSGAAQNAAPSVTRWHPATLW
jgi:hypothetical protein